jgi:hypothetical protein
MFAKILAFKETIRKFLNIVAVHIEGSGNPPFACIEHIFRVSVPLHSVIPEQQTEPKIMT